MHYTGSESRSGGIILAENNVRLEVMTKEKRLLQHGLGLYGNVGAATRMTFVPCTRGKSSVCSPSSIRASPSPNQIRRQNWTMQA